MINQSKFDLVFVVETWLNRYINDQEVCPKGYSIIRKDRGCEKRGGGLILVYKNHLQVTDITINNDDIESLCVDLLLKNSKPAKQLRFCCCYNPPQNSNCKLKTSKLCSLLKQYLNKHPCYFLGDFNFSGIDWVSLTAKSGPEEIFLSFCQNELLEQHVLEPTHTAGNCLDLILTNPHSDLTLESLTITEPFLSTCDHNMIHFSLSVNQTTQNKPPMTPQPCFQKGNYDDMKRSLWTVNWDKLLQSSTGSTVQDMYDRFISLLHQHIDKFVPMIKVRNSFKLPKNIRKSGKDKNIMYQLTKVYPDLKPAYKVLSKKYENEVKQWFERAEDKICNTKNMSAFYKYSKKKLDVKTSTIPPLKNGDGSMLVDDTEKANYFNEVFKSVFITDDGKDLNTQERTQEILDHIVISIHDIKKYIQKIPSKSTNC